MGLFNANAPVTADLNLLFQILILVFLVVGASLAKFRRRFMKHGAIMVVAMAMNTISIAIVMMPSLLSSRGLFSMPFTHPALVVFSHAIMGSLVEILGIWLITKWMFRNYGIKSCAQNRNIMRATIFLWFVELLLGIYVYTMLYLPI